MTTSAEPLQLVPIGVIRTPWRRREEAPRQGTHSEVVCTIEVFAPLRSALAGIERFPHLIVLYWADRAERTAPRSRRFPERGVLATRSPARPNPLNLCVVELLKVEGTTLRVRGLEALDRSPLIDLKPFYRELDCP